MARKSRKELITTLRSGAEPEKAQSIALEDAPRQYNTGTYARLSILETRDNKDNEALQNQKALLREYIAEHQELRLVREYEDNGETGTNFEREGFQRLIEDVRRGQIDCIVVKDLSRFGRDHVEVEHFLQHIFPHLGVRFIAISDGYDSADASTFDRLTVALKNIVNNIYSKDISLKSGAVLREKQARGEFIGAYASYGYIKDPLDRHRIIPDPESAQVVREIFRRKLEGQTNTAITRWLNAAGIPCPGCYRYQKGIVKDERYARPKPWTLQTVKGILHSEVYLGHMVQGRRICEFYANRPDRKLPRDEWTVVKNTHDPLISQEDFDRVQEINHKAREAYYANLGKYDALGKSENLLKGLVFCADCGRPLVRYKQVTSKGKHVNYYYRCSNYTAQLERSGCTYKFVPEEKLIGAVESITAKEIQVAADLKALIKQKTAQHTAAAEEAGRALKGALAEQNKLRSLRERLLRDYLAKLMDHRDYERIRSRYQIEEAELKTRIKALRTKQREENKLQTQGNPWFDVVSTCKLPFSLTRETAKLLVDRITVYDNTRWEVTFRFRDERQAILEAAMMEEAMHA